MCCTEYDCVLYQMLHKAIRFGHFATEMHDNPEEDDVLLLNRLWLAMLQYKKSWGDSTLKPTFRTCLVNVYKA